MPIILLFAFLGLLSGVIINRAADNLPPPARLSMLEAPRCGYCGNRRRFLGQIGLTGFLLAGGRCSHCHSPLPLRAPAVELGMLTLFAFIASRYGPNWITAGIALMTALLMLITVVDMEHRLILNVVVLPATLVALLISPILFNLSVRASAVTALFGMFVGYVCVFGIYMLGRVFVAVMARRRGRSIDEVAFGLGDVKLAGFVGALIGFPGIVSALVYAILLGGAVSLVVLTFQLIIRRRYAAFMAIPYGPFITTAAWVVMILNNGAFRAAAG